MIWCILRMGRWTPCRIIVLGQGDQRHFLRMYGIEYEILWPDVLSKFLLADRTITISFFYQLYCLETSQNAQVSILLSLESFVFVFFCWFGLFFLSVLHTVL